MYPSIFLYFFFLFFLRIIFLLVILPIDRDESMCRMLKVNVLCIQTMSKGDVRERRAF